MMAAVSGRNNAAEVILRKKLWAQGLRYRLYSKRLTGRPDLVFPTARVVVFVDGDYWHGRALVEGGPEALRLVIRGARFDWWLAKLRGNVERDQRVTATLEGEGWKVVRLWESAVLASPDQAAAEVARAVRSGARRGRSAATT